MLTDQERALVDYYLKDSDPDMDTDAYQLAKIADRLSQTGVMVGERDNLIAWYLTEPPHDMKVAAEKAATLLASGIIARVPTRNEIADRLQGLRTEKCMLWCEAAADAVLDLLKPKAQP